MKKLTFAASICLAALISLGGTVQADLVFESNFDSETVGNTLADIGSPWGGAGNAAANIVTGTAGMTGNQLELNAAAGAWTFVDNGPQTVTTGVSSLLFDAVNTNTTDGFLRVAVSRATANLGFFNINAGALSSGVNSIAVVANTSGASIMYEGNTLAHEEADIWINGVKNPLSLIDQGGGNAPHGSGAQDGFGLWMNGGTTAGDQVVIDNLSYHDMALTTVAVPEPSSVGLICLLGLGLLRRMRAA